MRICFPVLLALPVACSLILSGCSTPTAVSEPVVQKAQHSEFTDVTWKPETMIRPPLNAPELSIDPVAEFKKGLYAYYDDSESWLKIVPTQTPSQFLAETRITALSQSTLSWSYGSDLVYRNGQALTSPRVQSVSLLKDGRILFRLADKKIAQNIAARLIAFDVSGRPVKQLIRDSNNQPDTLAWYIDNKYVLPQGSRAYVLTFWLGDDEIVIPNPKAFTGATTLEQLQKNFTRLPFCISYLNHQDANPYGITFLPMTSKKNRDQGQFIVHNVNKASIFCEKDDKLDSQSGSWIIRKIHNTRVLELIPNSAVLSQDLGIQPINQHAIRAGFAELLDTRNKKVRRIVLPARIVKNNTPVVDFRLRFNDVASGVIREALQDAARKKANAEKK